MKLKKALVLMLSALLIAALCACANSEAAAKSAEPVEAAASAAPSPAGDEKPGSSYMRIKDISPLEEWYLRALSPWKHSALYEIHLEDEYTRFTAYVYKLEDGEWRRTSDLGFETKVEGDTCHLAVSQELHAFNIAFRNSMSSSSQFSTPEESPLAGASYYKDFELVSEQLIYPENGTEYSEGDEMPLIACRYRPTDGEAEKMTASVKDFHAPESVENGDVTEYYILTVKFTR